MTIGVTFFSYNSFPLVKRIRKERPKNKILVGGIGTFAAYNRLLKYADYCYFGEALEFNAEAIITKDFSHGQQVKVQRYVNYYKAPIVRSSKNSYYMMVETGCPYRCEFCYVSWVNDYAKISDDHFRKKIKFIDKKLKNKHIAFIGNEGIVKERNEDVFTVCGNNSYENQSMTVKKYLKHYEIYKNQSIARVGVELPTEELRDLKLPYIKRITDNELIDIVKHKHNRTTQFFYIWNYIDTNEDDYSRIHDIAKQKADFFLRLSFTSLEIQPYTLLTNRIHEHIKQTEKSIDFSVSPVIRRLKNISRVKVYPAKNKESLLRNYVFTYTLEPEGHVVTDKMLQDTVDNAKAMDITKGVITLVKFDR